MQNVIAWLRVLNGANPADVRLACPSDDNVFDEPWARRATVSSFGMSASVRVEEIKPFTKADILAVYDHTPEGA
jgi:hypothetical protein